MNKLTKEEVKHVGKLANLEISEEESVLFSQQLSAVLEHAERLIKTKTDLVPPLFNVNDNKNVFREDKVTSSLTQEECLKNAKSAYRGYIKVKAIFE